MTSREERDGRRFIAAVEVVAERLARDDETLAVHVSRAGRTVEEEIDGFRPVPVSDARVELIADALSRAHSAASDPLGAPAPMGFDSPAHAYGHYMQVGVEGLCDLSAAGGSGMWRTLDRLNEDELKFTIDVLAGHLDEMGWTPRAPDL